MTPFGSLAKSFWISVAVWLATFSLRLIMYRQGTEADWTFLDLFKLHSPGLSRTVLCCHALDQDVMRFDLHTESLAESLADAYCLMTFIGILLLLFSLLNANPL